MVDVLPRLREDGRRLGIVTAKRHRTVALAFDRFPWLEEQFEVVIGARRHRSPQARSRSRARGAAQARREPGGRRLRRRLALRHPRAARTRAPSRSRVSWGGIHSDERLLAEEPDAFVHSPEELLDVV